MEGMIDRVLEIVEDIQDFVSYAHCESEHYLSSKGLGRTGLNGFIIGGLLGFHLALLLVLLLLGPSSFIVSALVSV